MRKKGWRVMPTAIISVSDKTGIVDFSRGLVGMGWELIASAGTARLLRENELSVTEVSELTGFPEILDGRVKTLYPAIHAGLLARDIDADRKTLSELGLEMIDLAVVNLYPFE
jgi:phosphoribosylaminoimidazolecarboxamide formyltransferase / IMP cyclohydrolase